MQHLRQNFLQLIGPISAFDYQTISHNVQGLMPQNDFPLYCSEIIVLEGGNEKLQTFAQIQLKNWIKQYFGQADLIFKRQLTERVAQILLDSQTEQQCNINYEAFYLCLDSLILEDAFGYTSNLLEGIDGENYLKYAYVVAAACRRRKISARSREMFETQFTAYLFPYIANILTNAEETSMNILKVMLVAYQQSMNGFLTEEHISNSAGMFCLLQKLYFYHNQLKEHVLSVYMEYVKQYKKICNWDEEIKAKYLEFTESFTEFLPQLIQFAVQQLEITDELITQQLRPKFVKLVRLALETGPKLESKLFEEIFSFAVNEVEQEYYILIEQNIEVPDIFSLSSEKLVALVRQFDSELYTPLISDYLHSGNNETSTNPLLDELCRLIGGYFSLLDEEQLYSRIDEYFARFMENPAPEQSYAHTMCLAQLFRQLSLKLQQADALFNKLLCAINTYRQRIGQSNAFVALWFINAVINDLYLMPNYTLLVSELTNAAIEATPRLHSVGDLFESLLFIRYRLNTLHAHKVSYSSPHSLKIENLSILTQLLLHVTPSFPFYTEIYDSVQTAYELFVQDNPEVVSQQFSMVIKALYNENTHEDQLSDLLELFCVVFVIREAELTPDTCQLVLEAVTELLNAVFLSYRTEELEKLEISANSVVAISSNVEVSSFKEEAGAEFLAILRLFITLPFKYGDEITEYIAHAIICIVDVFCIWGCEQALFELFSTVELRPEMHNTNAVLKIVFALAFPEQGSMEHICNLMQQPIDLNIVSIREAQAVCIALFFMLREGMARGMEVCFPACLYNFSTRKDLNLMFFLDFCRDSAYFPLEHEKSSYTSEMDPSVLEACETLYDLLQKGEYTQAKQLLQEFPSFPQVVQMLSEAGCIIPRQDESADVVELELLGDTLDKMQLLSLEIARSLE